jgi:hypothetical protein
MPAWKVLLVSLGVAIVGIFLSYWALNVRDNGSGSPLLFGFLAILIVPLVLITAIASIVALLHIILFVFLFFTFPVKHFIVTKLGGMQTTGTVISSERCDDSEDVCVCGVYSYTDWRNLEHRVKFRHCYAHISKERWDEVMQIYGLGAQNPIYYFRWFPSIHEIQAKE